MRADAASLLRAQPFFATLDAAGAARLAAKLQRRVVNAGDMIFQRGDAGDALFIVESGVVRLSRDNAHGREFTVRLAGAGDMFGEIAVIDGEGRTTDAAAVAKSTLLSLARRDFQSAFRASPEMQDAVLGVLCGRLRTTTDQLETVALLPLEARLAQLFLLLVGPDADERDRAGFDLPVDQRELAALVGATRPRVNRVLVSWGEAGVVRRNGRRCDCDLDALRDIVENGGGA